MGKISKLPGTIRNSVIIFAAHCPICGSEAQDKRYKRPALGFVLTNRRITYRTITRECRVCGLRFSFTWKTFIKAIRKKANLEKNPKGKRTMLNRAKDIEDMLASGLTFEGVRDLIIKNQDNK